LVVKLFGSPLQVLSLAGQQNWEAFTDEVARKWIDLGLNPKPHW
jgi:hypothetical protein